MVITIGIHKGGVGKTATVRTIAQCLNHFGKKTLVIDTDAQQNATLTFDANRETKGIYEVLLDRTDIKEVIQHCKPGDIIPPGWRIDRLQQTSNWLSSTHLKEVLRPIKAEYEHIIIDTPPRIDLLLEDCLKASDGLIIPVEADTESFQGLREIVKIAYNIQKNHNKNLKIIGVFITRYDGRSNLAREYKEAIEDYCKALELPEPQIIHNGTAVREAAALRCNLYEYKPKSRPAIDYHNAIKEMRLL